MKKIFIVLWSIFISFHTLACEFQNGREYTETKKIFNNAPNIMEFFSFFCPYCYEFEKSHHVTYLKFNNSKQHISFQKYHVNFLGGELSSILTKSWIIAQQIGVEKKIILPVFQGIQETYTIHNIEDIKKIFKNEAGINESTFDSFWKSLTLKIIEKKNHRDIKMSHVDHIPMTLINGKYIIDYIKLEERYHENFSKKYIELINFLVQK